MRVVAGVLGGRRLVTPEGRDTRPTSEKVRAAICNSLEAHDLVRDAEVVDLFAGSGALGIEALSRGARSCTFVEQAGPALRALTTNLDVLGLAGRATVVRAGVDRWLARPDPEPFDLALVDPPYTFDGWTDVLDRLRTRHLVTESGRALAEHPRWMTVRRRTYGGTVVTFLDPSE